MSSENIFMLVQIMRLGLPFAFAVCILLAPRPRHTALKILLAIILPWLFLVFYTSFIYNPAGIAFWTELGIDDAQMHFDNNTTASMVLGGWMFPTIAIILFYITRSLWRRFKN